MGIGGHRMSKLEDRVKILEGLLLEPRRDAFAEAAVAVRALKLVGPAPLANLEGWCPTLEAAALAVEARALGE